jgi:hypothetical protein
MPSWVTTHANHRGRERVGLRPKAMARLAQRALATGEPPEAFDGQVRRYLTRCARAHGQSNIRVQGGLVYVFGAADALITVYPIPDRYLLRVRRRNVI